MRFPFQPRTATTDQDGRYRFDGVVPGRYRITVRKGGFAQPQGPELPELNLGSGERRDDFDVTLQKGAVIVGRVLDDAGEPVLEARVMVLQKAPLPPGAMSGGGPALRPAGSSGMTNDLGEFRLFSLPPGEYYVQAMAGPHFEGSQSARGTTMLPTYFPGTSDPTAAQPIAIGPGQTSADVVIRMMSAPAFQLSGVIVDQQGRPVENAMVRLVVDDPNRAMMFMMGPWGQSRSDASGKFSIENVTSGNYTLVATPARVASGRAAEAGVQGGSNGGVGFTSFVGNVISGTVAVGLMTETRDGVTVEYRDDTATRVPIAISDANVSGLEVIVRLPAR